MISKKFIRTFEVILVMIYRNRIFIALACAALLLTMGCKKTLQSIPINTLQKYFEDNILDKNFVVELATDTTTNRTGEFTGYTFILTKTTSFYDGPMSGTKDSVNYTGTWASNEDYSKLVIILNTPTPPASFAFLNRSWRFLKKSLPVMELVPWGSSDPKVLHMRRL